MTNNRGGATSWKGVFPSLPTAFSPEGAIDLRAQSTLVEFAVRQGAHGLICFGLAGEVFKLTSDERKGLTDAIVQAAAGRIPVLLGVSAESEHTMFELAKYAERAGADGIVIPPPVLSKLSSRLLRDFYLRVAEVVSVPIMLQDAPAYLGVELGSDLVAELAEKVPHLRYVKLETGPDRLASWVDKLGTRMGIFAGSGGLHMIDSIRAGAAGIAPGLDLVDVLVAVYEHEIAGDSAAAEKLFKEFLPMAVFELQDIDHYNACAKYVLRQRGVPLHPELRAPGLQLSRKAVALLDTYLDALLRQLAAAPGA